MRERLQSDFGSQSNTLSDCLGLCRMAGSEFQDRCLKPLGHPSEPLRMRGTFPPPKHRAVLPMCRSIDRRPCLWPGAGRRQPPVRLPPGGGRAGWCGPDRGAHPVASAAATCITRDTRA